MFDVIALDPIHAEQMEKLHKSAFEPGWSAADFRAYIKSEFDDVVGLLHGDEMVGFAVIRTQADQSEILTIIVSTDHRGQGFGNKLLAKAEQMARTRGADIMFLEVAADNPPAQVLYENSGYQRCGTRKAYYRRQKGRVDALLFQKHL